MGLREYKAKRDFKITAEPSPEKKSSKSRSLFVIQKHDASRLHYDFRLEIDGTLKSWAVPKGVPFKKAEKRLAMHVEDHPLDYARFEGIIPKGQYGGGTVMVWDIGTWEPLGGNPLRDLEKGMLHFALHGKKLKGEWTLVAMKHAREKNAWLLLKSGESIRPVSKKADNESILTRRTMAQIAAEKDAVWNSNREAQDESGSQEPQKKKKANSTARTAVAKFIEPMKAKLAESPPTGGDWIYELKFDGFRALAVLNGKRTELVSRNEKSLTAKFPKVTDALTEMNLGTAVLDGEIVALDAQGRSSFQLMQARETDAERPPICYYIFDLLNLDGKDLRAQPLQERKAALKKLLQGAPDAIRFSSELIADPKKLLAEVKQRGLEGLIAKRADSLYESGRRSGAWLKLKCLHEQEFVIGGYTQPQGSRKHFGAILVGYFEKKRLIFAGKVGTGFNTKLLKSLHGQFQKIRQKECPFSNLPQKSAGRWSQGVTPSEMRCCTWLKPELICQVKFTEWTREGNLRHPVFLGMRDDKKAGEVVRETPA